MTGTRRKGSGPRPKLPETVPILLTLDEVVTLVRLASYYGRVSGAVRRVIQTVGAGEMRIKARFVQEESYWLRRFAVANQERMEGENRAESLVHFTPRSLIAFYGRILGTLNLPRTRRRMSPQQIGQREALAEKLRAPLVKLYSEDRLLVEGELETRRFRERGWIEDALRDAGGSDPNE